MQRIISFLFVTIFLLLPRELYAEDKNPGDQESAQIERGRYLTLIGGCNDCHTPGFAMSGGKIAESEWLTGDSVGWHGPWGTAYPANLRLLMSTLTEVQWIVLARTSQPRAPMPWHTVQKMTDEDLRALYHFIRSLGSAGKPAPQFLAPSEKPAPPFIDFPLLPPSHAMN